MPPISASADPELTWLRVNSVETGRSASELVQQALIDALALELIYIGRP
jgi:hypothetical protein